MLQLTNLQPVRNRGRLLQILLSQEKRNSSIVSPVPTFAPRLRLYSI